jgi:hypothetical protein
LAQTRRLRRQQKTPFPWTIFHVIGTIVQAYGLTQDFLTTPPPAGPGPAPDRLQDAASLAKPRLEIALFPLLSEAQYRLTQAIVDRFANPYLAYARSPEEIPLSRELSARDGTLAPETLRACHFAAL